MRDYLIWHPRGAQVSSGIRTRILEGTKKVTGRLKQIRNNLNTGPQLKDLSIYLATDSADFISKFLEFFTYQYEEYIDNSTLPPYQAITTVLDLKALIFE